MATKTKKTNPVVTETPAPPVVESPAPDFLDEVSDVDEGGEFHAPKMATSYAIPVIDQDQGSVTVVLRRELLGPVADCLIHNRRNGRQATRYSLGQKLLTAREILNGRVSPKDAGFGRVKVNPVK